MANCMMGFPNRIDAATLSGGAWAATLPRANIQNRTLGKVARTVNAALVSTQFDIDLGSAKIARIVSVINHNFTLAAKYRLRASNEAAAENKMLYSEQLDSAAWVKFNAAVTPNAATAPDGSLTADLLIAQAADSMAYQNVAVNPSTNYTYSTWLKSDVSTTINIVVFDSTFSTVLALSFLTLGTGWQRYSLPCSTGTNSSVRVVIGSGATFSTGESLYCWGNQLELGLAASSYYPTTAAAATRPAGYMDAWQSYSYDSGWSAVWPVVYPWPVLEWEDDNWWSGKYTAEQIAGYTPTLMITLAANKFARYWRLEVDDTTNPAGYLQLGRVFIGPAWQPTLNMSYGASNAWETKTEVQEARSGAEYFDRKTPYRVTRFSLDWMSQDEAFINAFELHRRAGIDQEIAWIQDPADTVHALRRQFVGRMRTLSQIEYPYPNINKAPFELKEIL